MSEIIFFTSGKCFPPYRWEVQAPDKMSCSEKSNTGSGVAAAKQEEKNLSGIVSAITVINLPPHSIAALPVFYKKRIAVSGIMKKQVWDKSIYPRLVFS